MSGSNDTRKKIDSPTSIISPNNNKKIIVENKGQNYIHDDQIAYDTYGPRNNSQLDSNNSSIIDPTLKIIHENPEFDILQNNFATNLDQISSSQNQSNKNLDELEERKSHDNDLLHKAPNQNQTS